MKDSSRWNSMWERRMHSQCTKFCGGRVQSLSLCASALTLLAIASYSISPLFNFPLFISSRALKATFSQPFIVDGSRAAMGPIGSTVSIFKCALKWRSRGEFAAFRRVLTSFVTPTNFSKYRFSGKVCYIFFCISQVHTWKFRCSRRELCSADPARDPFERVSRDLIVRASFGKSLWSVAKIEVGGSMEEFTARNDSRCLEIRRLSFSAQNSNASRRNSFTFIWAAGGKASVLGCGGEIIWLESLWYFS